MLKFIGRLLDSAEHQEKATYGLGYNLSLQRSSDNHVSSHRTRTVAKNFALARGIVLKDNSWYILQFTPIIGQSNQC